MYYIICNIASPSLAKTCSKHMSLTRIQLCCKLYPEDANETCKVSLHQPLLQSPSPEHSLIPVCNATPSIAQHCRHRKPKHKSCLMSQPSVRNALTLSTYRDTSASGTSSTETSWLRFANVMTVKTFAFRVADSAADCEHTQMIKNAKNHQKHHAKRV